MKKADGEGARAPLTMERVVDAALALVDEQGLEHLSMRKLGARLGVEAMALYHHVPSKDALLDRLVERVVTRADFLEADEDLGWRERLERFAHRYRAILVERPNLAPLIATRPVRSPEALRHLAAGGAALMRAGFTLEQCFHAGNAVAMLVIGAALAQVGPASRARVTSDQGSPFTGAMNDPASAVHDHDAIFRFALDSLLDGVAARIEGAKEEIEPAPAQADHITAKGEPSRGEGGLGTYVREAVMCHVLIIEDERLAAMHIYATVQQAGATSFSFADTHELALECARELLPEVIISDVRLAHGFGPDAVRDIQAAHGAIPTIFITATPEQCEGCDPERVLAKPFSPHALQALFERVKPH